MPSGPAGQQSWGNRLTASQQNNISCHFICISKVVQGRDPQTKMGSASGLDSGLGSAGETVASGISILGAHKEAYGPQQGNTALS